MALLEILTAIVALCVVIILHEFGHYIAAVTNGMKVDRFSVFGIGPAIVRLGYWRGTEFVIGAIPFGAYVQIRGMEADDDPASETDAASVNFRSKPVYQRAAVLAGGPIANYLTAIVIFFVVFAAFGPKHPQAIQIEDFKENSAALAAGLERGDALVRVGGTTIDPTRGGRDLVESAEAFRGQTMPVTVRRHGETIDAQIDVPEKGLALGVVTTVLAPRERIGIVAAAREAIVTPFATTAAQLKGLWKLVTRQLDGRISGPVEIVNQIAKSAHRGIADLLEMTAVISTLLGMFNLLPLPALDGGRLCFLGYEAVMRRRVSPRIEEMVHGYGMLVLVALMLIVTIDDVRSLF